MSRVSGGSASDGPRGLEKLRHSVACCPLTVFPLFQNAINVETERRSDWRLASCRKRAGAPLRHVSRSSTSEPSLQEV